MKREVTIDQTRAYLIHIISNLDGYALNEICNYLDIFDDDILKHFNKKQL